ncbi:type II secretion system protein [Microbispora bryophytorum]|uniref:Type II secretion system protein n=1 Tax=Microbispora bryophytorum TaxID=1460882 RepID=A0A8H9LC59_9ACTN|nr:type II secretion system protein [Microbispora bryophytorum]MBD3136118.1 type II secretion system protein [Microbispora bryophytorum]TQS07865.1 type II secretion system protein [Microbispora bryophytorum]GGO04585.1 type II secretion system protein [Microbispora bryophytorum]
MIATVLCGAVLGLGLFLLARALFPPRPGLTARLAALDQARDGKGVPLAPLIAPEEDVSELRRMLGLRLARFYAARGWEARSIKADLALLGKSFEGFLATKLLLGVSGLLAFPLLVGWLALMGWGVSVQVPLWSALVVCVIFFLLPDAQIRRDAAVRRRDFRHAVGAFLDLVSMNLAGGRGVPEALMMAVAVGSPVTTPGALNGTVNSAVNGAVNSAANGAGPAPGANWAMERIREALANARIVGITPWQALGRLGDEINVDELRDLSAALGLVADDGAKVRASLTARAATLRRRELAEVEGKAGERSQSMLVAQLLLCAGFVIFLSFPAAMKMLGA